MTREVTRWVRRAASGSDITWRYVMNRQATLAYRMHGGKISAAAAGVVRRLKHDGIAIVHVGELLGSAEILNDLLRAAAQVEDESAGRLNALRESHRQGGTGKQKPFCIKMLDQGEILRSNSVFARFALARPLMEVVNAYFGMYVQMTYCDLWHNFVAVGPPSQSQLWHRDPEDRHILKMFLYLSDVDEGAGPMTYARGSHRHPTRTAPHEHLDGETPRSDDAQLATVYGTDLWVTAYGPKGTLVFADTRGYHKGGWGLKSERVLYVSEFLSTAAGKGLSTQPGRGEPAGAASTPPGVAA